MLTQSLIDLGRCLVLFAIGYTIIGIGIAVALLVDLKHTKRGP